MDDLIEEFLVESFEALAELDADIVNLEQNPNDQDLLGKIFRLVHTIKGTCGFLGLPRLESLAHAAENVFGMYRDGKLDVTVDSITLILESIDRIKSILDGIEQTQSEPKGEDSDLISKLDAIFHGDAEGSDGGARTEEELPEFVPIPSPDLEIKSEEELPEFTPIPSPDLLAAQEEELPEFTPIPSPDLLAAQEEELPEFTPIPSPELLAEQEQDVVKEIVAVAPVALDAPDAPVKKKVTPTQTLRVSVDVLENLMTMVSELVLNRNQLLQILRDESDSEFASPLHSLNQVVSELQDSVMQTRMQPIGNAWNKLPRIIRDLSLELDKKIDFEMRGQDTELDRQVLDLIKDPLTHMVRNSADHGIETPADRIKAGKPESGHILLNAYHEGGYIIIKIQDDGKGLALDKIKEKILEKNLATETELSQMSAKDIQQFIFKAGFSTAEKVTSVSGRGVGMDVVRSNIEKIGGTTELDSTEGEGSTFTIKIPLTLAIVAGLIVETEGQRFAIPQLNVKELVRVSSNNQNQIEDLNGTPVLRLRDHLLPLVSLKDMLKIRKKGKDLSLETIKEVAEAETDTSSKKIAKKEKRKSEEEYIIVLQVGASDFGILVDRVFDTEEIVVKPVARLVSDIALFSGSTILGDGRVIMILDPNGLASSIGTVTSLNKENERALEEGKRKSSRAGEKMSLLLFKTEGSTPKAVPLSLVNRLENIEGTRIELADNCAVVQTRGNLMPLISMDGSTLPVGEESKPTIIFSDENSSVGLVVDEIIDIVEDSIDIKISANSGGLLGSAIIDGTATDVLDVSSYFAHNNIDWRGSSEAYSIVEGVDSIYRVLLVDDSPFFLNMLTPLLTVAGYDVTTVQSAVDAMEMCQAGEEYDVVVSDIEMPDMNGFEFARAVRKSENWHDVSLVALSSHATVEDQNRGAEAGFDNYIEKFDKETVLQTISQAALSHS